jgi:hypothetical protein
MCSSALIGPSTKLAEEQALWLIRATKFQKTVVQTKGLVCGQLLYRSRKILSLR